VARGRLGEALQGGLTAELDRLEAELLEALAGFDDALLRFARTLVATPSVNPPGDERAVALLVQEELARHGITDVRVLAEEPSRPNVIVDVGPAGARTLVLAGHLDTKPAGDLDAWEHDPWEPVTKDGELWGLGSGDMKCGVAGMVFAAIALAAVCPELGRLRLVFTADEEAGSIQGSKWLAENGQLAGDAAILGEPCGITREWESIDLVSRGAVLFRIRVKGTQTHSSISDRLPVVNATVKMAELIQRMDGELLDWLSFTPHPLVAKPTLNVGVMAQAGVFYGVYPGNAEFACDLRTLPGMDRDEIVADIEGFLADARAKDPELDAELVLDVCVPASEIDRGHPVVAALQAASRRVLGEAPPLGAFPGATDAPYFQLTAGIPTVAAFGPGLLPRAHSPNERLDVAGAAKAARIYALAALRYLS
jgi:acetylornithine deacetylase/succinyl-diaminopimelate desuccinylase-like protein